MYVHTYMRLSSWLVCFVQRCYRKIICHRLVAVYAQSSSILSFSSTDLQSTALYLYNKILKPVKLVVQVTIISFTEITGHE